MEQNLSFSKRVAQLTNEGHTRSEAMAKANQENNVRYWSQMPEGYSQHLLEMISALEQGMILEYGERSHPGGYLSGIRCRFMKTAGGIQYGIHSLNSFGQQSGGEYTPDVQKALQIIKERQAYYHRISDLPILREPRPLGWFTYAEKGKQRDTEKIPQFLSDPVFHDAEEIVFTLND